jgi:LPS O-antigen subunit length determinant protein (WzzB/FepE family)
MGQPAPDHSHVKDELILADLLRTLYHHKLTVILVTAIGLAASVTTALLTPNVYRSDGSFSFPKPRVTPPELTRSRVARPGVAEPEVTQPGVTPPEVTQPIYKEYESQFTNPSAFVAFVRSGGMLDEQSVSQLRKSIRAKQLSAAISPVYAYSREDLAKAPQAQGKAFENYIAGVQIAWEESSASKARRIVDAIGRFVRDRIILQRLYDYLSDTSTRNENVLRTIENQIIQTKFSLLQNRAKAESLRSILTEFPSSANLETRQVISTQDGGYQFLSPVAQLVGARSQATDLTTELRRLEREKEKAILLKYFSDEGSKILAREKSGDAAFSALLQTVDTVTRQWDKTRDPAVEVENTIRIDMNFFRQEFYESYRFVNGPTTPDRPVRSRILKVLLGLSISFPVALLAAFFAEWWRGNRNHVFRGQQTGT